MTYNKVDALDPRDKAKWLEALRSGKYIQHHGNLCDGRDLICSTKFCCIGVGAVVVGLELFEQQTWLAIERLGLSDKSGQKLIDMNDEKKIPFDQIADWIERNL